MSRRAGLAIRWLLLSAALSPAAGGARTDFALYPAFLSPCETTRIDAGRPEARWALGAGVYEDERDRRGGHFVWTSREWRARLLLSGGGDRTLRLRGRRGPPRLRLRAFWNGVDLGVREVEKGPTTVSWPVPAAAVRAGLNDLRFEASAAREVERRLSFLLDRLELEPGGDCGPVQSASADTAFTLPPGAVLLALVPLPPDTELEVELVGEPGSLVELHLSRHGERRRRLELIPGGEPRTVRLALGDALPTDLVFISRGPAATRLRLVESRGDERPAAWRAACGLLWKGPLAAAGLLALLALAVAAGRRWPSGRRALWLDCGLLLALALALRYAYLEAYPTPDWRRFGDSWEYLKRSRYLIQGMPFWSSTSWHAWLTWIRPPGYYLFLAAILGPLAGNLPLVAQIQAVMLAATAVCAYLIAHPLFGRGAALATGLLVAVYPQTITSASWILSDSLSLFLTTAALACLAWLATRPSRLLAVATGALFGAACLVRSAPLYYVPLAALLLYLGQRAPRRRAPALTLLAAALVVVLPWCVRNSVLYGKPMGIDDLMIPNFLMAHPDPEILPAELQDVGVWGKAEETREEYFRYLWRGNADAHLTRASGRILARGLVRMAANPGITLRRFGLHLKIYFQGFPREYAAHFLGEPDECRVSTWTDSLNLVYLLTLILAVPGSVLALRRRQAWPLIAWVLFFVVVTNLFFYPSYMPGRYRLPIYPALAALAGLALSRAGELWPGRPSRRRSPPPGA